MKKIILDVDTGIDDAIGIMLACASQEIDIQAITTVSGNIDLVSATRNTLRVLKVINKYDIPVYAGEKAPLKRDVRYATEIHGSTGLAGQLPDVDVETRLTDILKSNETAVDVIIKTIKENKNEITMVMTGPETNFARALEREPQIQDWVKEVIIMGGAADIRGNESPVAEFNIAIDPEAAEMVFSSRASVTMVGLDVTTRALLTRDRIAEITSNKVVRDFVHGATYDYMERYHKKHGVYGCCMHDPLAVSLAIDPDLVKKVHRFVGVETNSHYCDGMTVCDFDGRWNKEANVHVAMDIEPKIFIDFLIDRLNRL
ncbi:nucleoside hydrolase [Fusibacter sp. JL216-2]|uniref:nucleoside hydrolase n=1 Tax=Fusibacter sp. JL216-2 TaxID=3071453 RepID=UPI003D339F6F